MSLFKEEGLLKLRLIAIVLILVGAILATFGGYSLGKNRSRAIKADVVAATPSPKPIATTKQISGMVVPHHDLVKVERGKLFDKVTPLIPQPKTVILISPNHYESGKQLVQTTSQSWNIDQGTIEPNKTVIDKLVANGVGNEPDSFANEHGIRLILSDLKDHFPNATIVPLIFKLSTPLDQIQSVEKVLASDCADCFMVASVDFSHYQPAILAQVHDQLTERALKNLDATTLLKKAEVDSPAALTLLTEWANDHDTKKFALDNHTNSGVLLKDPDAETTTHFFGWYESGEKAVPDNSVTFLIGGDMMFGRSIAHRFLSDGLWKSVDQLGERLFWGTDAGIVNLEGPVSDVAVPDDVRPNNLVFNFPPETIKALQYLRINAASQANNHSANQGKTGLETTRRLLKDASITPIGGPGDADVDKVASFEGQNLTLQVIGAHTLSSVPDLKPLIQKLKADPKNRVLIFPHWGVEYQYKHSAGQEKQAHDWIDAGADVVIGAHPHIIEDSELYKGKPIIYSMGNLLFDQDFSKETQQGLLLSGTFTDSGLDLFALPIQDKNYKPALMKGDDKKSILDRLYAPFTAQKQSTPAGDLLHFNK